MNLASFKLCNFIDKKLKIIIICNYIISINISISINIVVIKWI